MLQNFKNGYEVSEKSEIAKKEKNDCVVRALANAFEVNYNMAHVFVSKRFDRKKEKGTKLFNSTLKDLSKSPITFKPSGQLDLFNPDGKTFEIEHIGDMPKLGGKLINRTYKHKKVAYTVKAFAQKFNKGTYIVLVHKHAFAIKDGVLIDNGNYQFNGYRRVVESAFKVK
tara:strand:+ start:251 stop:760 length:510 start_codon:yes stop_codon:yes gene_type:complete